ncbi:hypothetical protein WJU16_22740 [Chitinophaga pollutisoli]|uniref:Glycoside hydrolase family 57 N-terminal domain-containing protein n=1 Tax=Chitinophaga pollutisoli TaxID=3133966 RepID=A0ABZ2YN21_9BACT
MKNVCLVLQLHQPSRLRHFPFTRIGGGGPYFDDRVNAGILEKVAKNCYLPINRLLMKLIRKSAGAFRIAVSVSGTALDQFEHTMPVLTKSFRELQDTGCVEFLSETFAHTVPCRHPGPGFRKQILAHSATIERLFGIRPRIFRHHGTGILEAMADVLPGLGFTGMILNEIPSSIPAWTACNLFHSPTRPAFKLMVNHRHLADDIAIRFSDRQWPDWPLTAQKFASRLLSGENAGPLVNVCIDYETFGERHHQNSGIFHFLETLPAAVLRSGEIQFATPSEAMILQTGINSLPFPPIPTPPVTGPYLRNDLQQDAYHCLEDIETKMAVCSNEALQRDWLHLQSSDHFLYMGVAGPDASYGCFSPYKDPFDAYVNYMNVLTDFSQRVEAWLKTNKSNIYGQHTAAAGFHI